MLRRQLWKILSLRLVISILERVHISLLKMEKFTEKTAGGLFPENDFRTNRIVNGYKIHVDHFECALSYSNYYILDFKNECIYESRDNTIGRIQDLVESMKDTKNIEECF